MARAAKAFETHRRSSVFQPVAEQDEKPSDKASEAASPPPYERVHPSHPPAMRLRLQFRDGMNSSFSYADLREVHQPHAGLVRLDFMAMRAVSITIAGRHLNELGRLLDHSMVRSIQESDHRDVDRSEDDPAIQSITVTPYQPPSP